MSIEVAGRTKREVSHQAFMWRLTQPKNDLMYGLINLKSEYPLLTSAFLSTRTFHSLLCGNSAVVDLRPHLFLNYFKFYLSGSTHEFTPICPIFRSVVLQITSDIRTIRSEVSVPGLFYFIFIWKFDLP